MHTGFWWGDLRESDHLKDLAVDGEIILQWILKTWNGGMDWIHLSQDSYRWLAFVNAVLNLRVS